MYPEIHLGPLTLQTFGLMFALAFLAAGALLWKRFEELGKPPDWAYEMGFAALVGGIVGSRLYFIVQNYGDVKDDLLGNLFSGSGLVWFGGVAGGAPEEAARGGRRFEDADHAKHAPEQRQADRDDGDAEVGFQRVQGVESGEVGAEGGQRV